MVTQIFMFCSFDVFLCWFFLNFHLVKVLSYFTITEGETQLFTVKQLLIPSVILFSSLVRHLSQMRTLLNFRATKTDDTREKLQLQLLTHDKQFSKASHVICYYSNHEKKIFVLLFCCLRCFASQNVRLHIQLINVTIVMTTQIGFVLGVG